MKRSTLNIIMSVAVTVPNLTVATLIVSEESLAREGGWGVGGNFCIRGTPTAGRI